MVSSATAVSLANNQVLSKEKGNSDVVEEKDEKKVSFSELSSIVKSMKNVDLVNILSERFGLKVEDLNNFNFKDFFEIFSNRDKPEGYISIIGLILGVLTWPIGLIAGLIITIVGLLLVPVGFIAGILYGWYTPGYFFELAGGALIFGLGWALMYPLWVSMWTYEILWNVLFPNVDIMQPPD